MGLVRLFNNLKISQKLLMISCSFSLPVAVLLYLVVHGINYDINFSQYEFYGDTYQRPLEKTFRSISEHGFLYKQHLLKPSELTRNKLRQKEREVDDAIADLLKVHKELGVTLQFTNDGLGKRKREHFRPETLASEWQQLKSVSQSDMSAEQSEERHRHLKNDLRTMITHIGDTSNLILDPDLDSYYTMDVTLLALPQTQDRLDEIINFGMNVLQDDTLSQEERIKFAVYAAQLREADVDRINVSLKTALTEDGNFLDVHPHFQKIIPPALDVYNTKSAPFVQMIQDIASGKHTGGMEKFFEVGMAAWDASFDLWEIAVEGEDSLLKNRIRTFQAQAGWYLFWTLLSVAVSILLAFAITRSITRPLKLVADNLKAQAAMDFTKKIEISRTDELGEMAIGINHVAGVLEGSIQKIVTNSKVLFNSSNALAMSSSELSKSVENSPWLQDMVKNTQEVAKEVSKTATDLKKLAERFRF